MNKILSIRIPEEIYEKLLAEVERSNYKDVSELIRSILFTNLIANYHFKRNDNNVIEILETLLLALKKNVDMKNAYI